MPAHEATYMQQETLRRGQSTKDQFHQRCGHTYKHDLSPLQNEYTRRKFLFGGCNTQSIFCILIIIPPRVIPWNAACNSLHPTDALNRSKFSREVKISLRQPKGDSVRCTYFRVKPFQKSNQTLENGTEDISFGRTADFTRTYSPLFTTPTWLFRV